jgi:SAM-dependent MidA family methyltransferase
MNPSAAPSPLLEFLAKRIRERGPMPFADFMRVALYAPGFGYYSRKDARRFADFYTSVDVHPIFGRLLARQLAEMWDALGRPAEFLAVEGGAGVGRLAGNILDFVERELGDFYGALRYVAIEQSAARRGEHAAALGRHLASGHAVSETQLPESIPAGCIFSNELLDALPVHRVVREGGALREIYVALHGDKLVEETGALTTPEIAAYFQEQGVTLREGQQAESGLAACKWIVDAGRRLGRGFVLTVDYGHEAARLYSEQHNRGTVLAYAQHRVSEDLLAAPGEQDLTAHVNFTALDLWGRRAGLTRTGLVSQTAFLVAMGRGNEFADLYKPGATEVERVRARLMLKTLIYPEGMGETFKVLIQHKLGEQMPPPKLTGLSEL